MSLAVNISVFYACKNRARIFQDQTTHERSKTKVYRYLQTLLLLWRSKPLQKKGVRYRGVIF